MELHSLDDIKTKYYGEVGTPERDRIENELAALRGKMHRCNNGGMGHFDEKMLVGMHTASELLDSKYGAVGTESRAEFERDAHATHHRAHPSKPSQVRWRVGCTDCEGMNVAPMFAIINLMLICRA